PRSCGTVKPLSAIYAVNNLHCSSFALTSVSPRGERISSSVRTL
uniref:Uncharacterized protein n=1 Tax=Mesocestoides corti TaxID=53468 RepID=A0A5K3G1L6_MESCO